MTGEDVLAYCLAKPGAWQDEPWEGDVVAKVREHLCAVLMLDMDGHTLGIVPERGELTVLTNAADRPALELLRRRKHPLLRSPALRALRAS